MLDYGEAHEFLKSLGFTFTYDSYDRNRTCFFSDTHVLWQGKEFGVMHLHNMMFNKDGFVHQFSYNGYIENLKSVKNALIFYLKRFGVKVLEEEKYRYGILIQWNDDFVNKLDIALKIVISNEKMNKLNEDFKE
jgi:hypothetical protein